jgi:hypothetical protein
MLRNRCKANPRPRNKPKVPSRQQRWPIKAAERQPTKRKPAGREPAGRMMNERQSARGGDALGADTIGFQFVSRVPPEPV